MLRFEVEPVPLAKLKKKDFAAYERVRKSGCFNMITEAHQASEMAGLDIEVYKGIIKNYEALMKKYPGVRK